MLHASRPDASQSYHSHPRSIIIINPQYLSANTAPEPLLTHSLSLLLYYCVPPLYCAGCATWPDQMSALTANEKTCPR
jgi:hypothetical protein